MERSTFSLLISIPNSQGGTKGLRHIKRCTILSISVIVLGIFSLLPAISLSIINVVIESSGVISTGAYARSGSAEDIQAAVDWVAATEGIGNVYIPAGTFNFVEVGEPWMTIEIPAGVNLFGAPTERDSDGQVVEWQTVLTMPFEAPSDVEATTRFFRIAGTQNPDKSSRFSDIKLVGYREINPDSTTLYRGVVVEDVLNCRVDHCSFRNLGESGVDFSVGEYGMWGRKEYGRTFTSGVVDHCSFVNTAGVPYGSDGTWYTRTVGYGVSMSRGSHCEEWDENIQNVFGQYTPYTVFIEDCHFERWRHCVCGGTGSHWVLRHSTVSKDFGYGSVDSHGQAHINSDGRVIVGCRAAEIYDNQFVNPVNEPPYSGLDVFWQRGGAGLFFNNTLSGYDEAVSLSQEAPDTIEKCQIKDTYVWNNVLGGAQEITVWYGDSNPIEEGVDYFLHAPQTFTYEPYPYPHPLTIEAAS